MKLIKNELVPVYETDKGSKVVVGRELHQFLNVETRFNDWIERRIEKYGFIEGEDFSSYLSKSTGGRPTTEYTLQIDMAKELSMVESTPRGSLARKYFIQIEKQFKQIQPMSQMEMIAEIAKRAAEKEKEDQRRDEEIKTLRTGMNTIQQTIIERDEDWRRWINKMFNTAVMHTSDRDFQSLRNESYKILEERGRCDLNTRQRNMKGRLENEGATKTKINTVSKMDVIETDARLKEIYTAIVKELSIRYVPLELVR